MTFPGWRMRIGLMVPSSNTTMETELFTMAPEGVSIHSARLRFEEGDDIVRAEYAMAEEMPKAVKDLASAEVDIIVYGCTTGSLIGGISWEREIRQKIGSIIGIPVVTTAKAVVDAFQVMGIRKVVVATPYQERLNELERKFLEENGISVLHLNSKSYLRNTEIGREPPSIAYKLAKAAFTPEAEGVFISCTNFRSIDIIEMLESDLGRPVITSNQASLWAALRMGDIHERIKGYGRLLIEH